MDINIVFQLLLILGYHLIHGIFEQDSKLNLAKTSQKVQNWLLSGICIRSFYDKLELVRLVHDQKRMVLASNSL